MSDDLRKAVQELQSAMEEVRGELQDLRGIQNVITRQMGEVKDQSAAAEGKIGSVSDRFQGFREKFNEVSEMLITHDTDQLQRVTAVENENAGLKQTVVDLVRRVEALEKRAS